MGLKYDGVFSSKEIAFAKRLVTSFINKGCFVREDFEDLMQECLTHYYFVRGTYKAAKGAARATYMWRIVTNKLRDLVDKKAASKRSKYATVSLYEPISDDNDTPLIDTIVDLSSKDFRINISYRVAMTELVPKLTNRQKIILKFRIDGVKVKEIARRLNIHRDTVYEDIKSVEMMFES